jgi:undecaprenyl diphosphate synthase
MGLAKGKFREMAENGEFFSTNGIRVRITGETDMLPPEVNTAMQEIEELTKTHTNCTLNVCLAYGGLEEICNSVNAAPAPRTRQQFFDGLHISEPVDLLLRTGEARLSNFLQA